MKSCWSQQSWRSILRDSTIFRIFFRQDITVPIFIIVGYVWWMLGRGALLLPPSVSSPKGLSWIGLNVWLGSEYVSDISSLLKSTSEITLYIYTNICYGLNTATIKMELLATIGHGFYILNVTFQILDAASVEEMWYLGHIYLTTSLNGCYRNIGEIRKL